MWAYPHLEYYHNHRPPRDRVFTGSGPETYSRGSRKLSRAIVLFADTPSCEMNGLPNSEFIVFVHRDKLLLEMTEEYVIYHGGLRALQRLW